MAVSPQLQAAIAAHRFGLGEPDLGVVGSDAEGWLAAQIGPADPARGSGLLDTPAALGSSPRSARSGCWRRIRRRARPPSRWSPATIARPCVADARSRLATAAATPAAVRRAAALVLGQPLHRLDPQGLDPRPGRRVRARRDPAAHRRPVRDPAGRRRPPIRRCCATSTTGSPPGRTRASSRCEARRAARRAEGARVSGINENLAREVLELHTLGAEGARHGAYTQADVTAFAAVLSGWRIGRDPAADGSRFDANWHEPGTKTVLGKSYAEGPEALHAAARTTSPAIRRRPASSPPSWRATSSPTSRRRRWSSGWRRST